MINATKVIKISILDEILINSTNKYNCIRQISHGGYAYVYECEGKDGKRYALKNVNIIGDVKKEKGDRLEREILQNKELQHPNIIRLHEYLTKERIYVLVKLS
jgi:serine/threonine protein kinase